MKTASFIRLPVNTDAETKTVVSEYDEIRHVYLCSRVAEHLISLSYQAQSLQDQAQRLFLADRTNGGVRPCRLPVTYASWLNGASIHHPLSLSLQA